MICKKCDDYKDDLGCSCDELCDICGIDGKEVCVIKCVEHIEYNKRNSFILSYDNIYTRYENIYKRIRNGLKTANLLEYTTS